jgi:hypothetical protein
VSAPRSNNARRKKTSGKQFFFEKKNQKLFEIWATDVSTSTVKINKVFARFFQKALLA